MTSIDHLLTYASMNKQEICKMADKMNEWKKAKWTSARVPRALKKALQKLQAANCQEFSLENKTDAQLICGR